MRCVLNMFALGGWGGGEGQRPPSAPPTSAAPRLLDARWCH